jgi:hypothetical protein
MVCHKRAKTNKVLNVYYSTNLIGKHKVGCVNFLMHRVIDQQGVRENIIEPKGPVTNTDWIRTF